MTFEQELEFAIPALKYSIQKYKDKFGTYPSGPWKRINENRIVIALSSLEELLLAYETKGTLTNEEIAFALKLIRNAIVMN
jgi:hypothetical protein